MRVWGTGAWTRHQDQYLGRITASNTQSHVIAQQSIQRRHPSPAARMRSHPWSFAPPTALLLLRPTCSSCTYSFRMCWGLPLATMRLRPALARMISTSLCVRSSSHLGCLRSAAHSTAHHGTAQHGCAAHPCTRMKSRTGCTRKTASTDTHAHKGSKWLSCTSSQVACAPNPTPPHPYRALLSIMTLGRTGGGGTGSTDTSSQSGRVKRVSKPSALQSSSLICDRIL